MKCPHCGEDLPNGFVYIPPKHEDEIQPEQNTEASEQTSEPVAEAEEPAKDMQSRQTESAHPITEAPSPDMLVKFTEAAAVKRQYNRRLIASIAAVIVVIAGVFIGFRVHGTSSLRSKITGTWASAGSLMTTGKLTITEDTISYSETFGFMEMNGQTMPYKAVSKDTIKIQGIKHKISFDSSSNTMTITPGITTNGSEVWYSTSMQGDTEQENEQSDSNNAADSDGNTYNGVL